ncbi:MAG: hypothetical protein RL648_1156 [Verrucomicrobiota bacterium]
MLKRKVVILGATGSVGQAALSVIGKHPHQFELLGVAANRNGTELDALAHRFNVPHTALFSKEGLDGLMRLATLPEADLILVATTGTIGVQPTIAALESGKSVGLANKETLVLAGPFVMETARQSRGTLLPVDSEHNAIFQCLQGVGPMSRVRRIILTASGGPFLHLRPEDLASVTPEQALQHPNWSMGPKITIDSATMANKGLEMIEARWLFDLQADAISVVIHPQSLIHSMVECVDGSLLAQIAPPSMEFPVQHVLSYPDRLPSPLPPLDLTLLHHLDLQPPDLDRFPCLRLASEALAVGGMAPAVFNAANSLGVEAFLERRLAFTGIPRLIDACLSSASFSMPASIRDLLELEHDLNGFARSQLKAFRI